MQTCGYETIYNYRRKEFKNSLERNKCAIALNSCYLYNKKILNIELKMKLVVLGIEANDRFESLFVFNVIGI